MGGSKHSSVNIIGVRILSFLGSASFLGMGRPLTRFEKRVIGGGESIA
jgi:hypothetical protein